MVSFSSQSEENNYSVSDLLVTDQSQSGEPISGCPIGTFLTCSVSPSHSLLRANQPFTQRSMKTTRRNSSAKSSSSSLETWASHLSFSFILFLFSLLHLDNTVSFCFSQDMEVSPNELMNILNRIISKRKRRFHLLHAKLSSLSFTLVHFSFSDPGGNDGLNSSFVRPLKDFFPTIIYSCFRWRPEDRWLQHRILQEHGGCHGRILSVTCHLSILMDVVCFLLIKLGLLRSPKVESKVEAGELLDFLLDFLNTVSVGQHRETWLPWIQTPVEQHKEMAGRCSTACWTQRNAAEMHFVIWFEWTACQNPC